MITNEQKEKIVDALKKYVERYPSQNSAAQSLNNCSPATISAMINGKWMAISDNMWKSISVQVQAPKEWVNVETTSFKTITSVLEDARENANCLWITGSAGCGKTTTAKIFAADHKNVFYIQCDADMQKADFVRETARACGIQSQGIRMRDLIIEITAKISISEKAVIIFDEADKLNEGIFYYFIDLYNKMEDLCGIVFLSTDYIKQRIHYGLQYNKKGYNEIFSRIGRKFFELDPTTTNDVISICMANGLSDKKMIKEAVKDAGLCDNDLRRLKRAIHRVKKIVEAQTVNEEASCE
jgi:DNA transposition AAA+ family ATPase